MPACCCPAGYLQCRKNKQKINTHEEKSKHLGTESITRLHIARLQTGVKPSHALLAAAVCEAVGLRVALALFLQRVITYRRRCVQCFFNIAFVQPQL